MPDLARKRRRGASIVFASGKGGVGKTNVVGNLAVLLAAEGRSVVAVDGDLGLANLDLLFGLAPSLTVGHFLDGTHSLDDVTIRGPHGVSLVPAASGVAALTSLDGEQDTRLHEAILALTRRFDVTLIDGPAGVSSSISQLARAADRIAVVTCPEPTALVDAYALVKILHGEDPSRRFGLIVNNAKDAGEGERVHQQIDRIAARFLGRRVGYLGHIVRDELLVAAVQEQRLVTDFYPEARSSRCLEALAARVAAELGTVAATHDGAAPSAVLVAPGAARVAGAETIH